MYGSRAGLKMPNEYLGYKWLPSDTINPNVNKSPSVLRNSVLRSQGHYKLSSVRKQGTDDLQQRLAGNGNHWTFCRNSSVNSDEMPFRHLISNIKYQMPFRHLIRPTFDNIY